MFHFRLIYFIFLLFSLFAVSVIQPSPSKATNFFKWLLEHNKQEQKTPQIIEQKIDKPQKTIRQKNTHKLKKETAKRILVIGDFVASAVADALKNLFTDNNDIIIINNTIPNSGLIQTDHISWKSNLSELIDKNKPDVIIIVIGANDNQPITTPYGTFSVLEPEWLNIYKQRITETAESLHTLQKPWIWIGQPAFGNDHLTQKMKIFNEFYRKKTEEAGGYFLDIWSGFTDEQGQFSFSGYDVHGKIVKLRTNNGIHFTFEGKKKLAFYLESPLKNILNFDPSSHKNRDLTHTNNRQFITQEPDNIVRKPPMSLDAIAQQNTSLLNKTNQSFIKKLWLPPNGHQKDRADNFSLP
ncbi:SGNH family hydrolase [Bartonella senegalensis]|uniref:SGNH/GDSL hydrolase family protein n=1 Tax=Bartonella senegalensis TaxID=1468418 RepID=UPI0018A80D90|nr:SGNH family hydrolase [Bartonella senegalensis]